MASTTGQAMETADSRDPEHLPFDHDATRQGLLDHHRGLLSEISQRKEAKIKDLQEMEQAQESEFLEYPLRLGGDVGESSGLSTPAPATAILEVSSATNQATSVKAVGNEKVDSAPPPKQHPAPEPNVPQTPFQALRSLSLRHSRMLLVRSSRKVVLSDDWKAAREERRVTLTLQRIDELKRAGLWSMHQLKRHSPPSRKKAHWDYVLDEMEWLSIDFREERKWKQALAFVVSRAILEYHQSPDKRSLQIKNRYSSPPSMMDVDSGNQERLDEPSLLFYAPSSDQAASCATICAPHPIDSPDDLPLGGGENTSYPLIPMAASLFKKERRRPADLDEDSSPTSFHGPLFKRLCPTLPEGRLYLEKKTASGLFSALPPDHADSSGHDEAGADPKGAAPPKTAGSGGSDSSLIPENLRTLVPPKGPIPSATTENWTADEDRELFEAASNFDQNWALVCDGINTKRRHLWGPKRTPSECFVRLQKLLKDPKKFALITEKPVSGADDEEREEIKRKLVNQFSVYDHVKRMGGIKPQYAIPPPPQKKISLVAHDSHSIAAVEAGVNMNARPLTPNDLANRIAQHQHQQMLLNQQMQNAAAGMPVGGPPMMGNQYGAPYAPPGPLQNPPPPHMQQPPHAMGAGPLHPPHGGPPQMGAQLMGPNNGGGSFAAVGAGMQGRPIGGPPPMQPQMGGQQPLHHGGRGLPPARNPGFGGPGPAGLNGGLGGPIPNGAPTVNSPAMVNTPISNQPQVPYGYQGGPGELQQTPNSPTLVMGRGRGIGEIPPNYQGRPSPMGNPNYGRPMPSGAPGGPPMGPMPPRSPHLTNSVPQPIPNTQHTQQLQQQLQQLKQLHQLQQLQNQQLQNQQRQQQQHHQQHAHPQQQHFSPAVDSMGQVSDQGMEQHTGPALRQMTPGGAATTPGGPRQIMTPSAQPDSPASQPQSPSEETPKRRGRGAARGVPKQKGAPKD